MSITPPPRPRTSSATVAAPLPAPAGQGAVPDRQLQLRLRGDHPRPPHAAEPAHPLPASRCSCSAPRSRSASTGSQLIALRPRDRASSLVAEMLNTAIEGAIDVSTTSVRPEREAREGHRRRRRPDRVGHRHRDRLPRLPERGRRRVRRPASTACRDAPADITLVALVLVVLIVIATKAWTGRGTPLRGGLPSGPRRRSRSPAGCAITYLGGDDHRFLISALTFIMAAARRADACRVGRSTRRSRSPYGGVLGALVTLVVFQLS